MYLDAEEIFRLAGDAQCRLERDDGIHAPGGGGTHVAVAFPVSISLPGEVESGLAVIHDGWDAVVVISRHFLAADGILTCRPQVGKLFPDTFLFPCQIIYPGLVDIVPLTEHGCFLHCSCGNLLYQRPVLAVEHIYLGLKLRYAVVVFRLKAVKLRHIKVIVSQCGLHGALLGMGVQ